MDNRFFIRSSCLNRIKEFSASGFRIFTLTLKRCSLKTFICLYGADFEFKMNKAESIVKIHI